MSAPRKLLPDCILAALILLTCLLAVSGQSLWIDEANTAVKAIEPTWAGFQRRMALERGSDLQMPLYMVAIWAWEKVAGPSEFGLRALNIPLLLIALAAIRFLLDRPTLETQSFALLAIFSPMLWAYLDEARPYVLQFLGATLFLIALLNLASGRGRPGHRELLLGLIGGFLLSGASLTGVIYTFFFGLAFLALWQRREPVLRLFLRPSAMLALVGWGILMGGLAVYYAWTLKTGSRASSIGTTSPATMVFCLYELTGAAGLGPGRTTLREAGPAALRAYLPGLGLFLLATAAFALAGASAVRGRLVVRWPAALPFVAALTGAAAIVGLGILMDFRVVGRHLIPVLPVFLYLATLVFTALWISGRPLLRTAGAFYLFVLLVSSLSLRFSPRFAKDDYREAAKLASQTITGGGLCWWAADPMGAAYYGLAPVLAGESGQVFFANGRDAAYLSRLPEPESVVLSKTDIYDATGALRDWMKGNRFTVTKIFPAFTIWEREK